MMSGGVMMADTTNMPTFHGEAEAAEEVAVVNESDSGEKVQHNGS